MAYPYLIEVQKKPGASYLHHHQMFAKKGPNYSLLSLLVQALIDGRRHPKEYTCHSSLTKLAYYLCSHGSSSAIGFISNRFLFSKKRQKGTHLTCKDAACQINKKRWCFYLFHPSDYHCWLTETEGKGEVEETEEY